jgi:hypothetical protein
MAATEGAAFGEEVIIDAKCGRKSSLRLQYRLNAVLLGLIRLAKVY